jgi:hypothetical protein
LDCSPLRATMTGMKAFILVILLATAAFAQAPRQATLHQQKMCADQADKRFNAEPSYRRPNVVATYTSHYDSKLNVCYMRVNERIDDGKDDAWSVETIYDAYENRELGLYMGPIKANAISLQCNVKPVGRKQKACDTEVEFDELAEKFFGLGR